MTGKLKPVSRIPVSDAIAGQIASLIRDGGLAPGDRVPSETQLCLRFGVGRTSVREALRSLAAMGLLASQQGGGTFVSGAGSRTFLEKALEWGLLLDRKLVDDLIETRSMLEAETASLAAARASARDLEAIAAAVATMQRSIRRPARYLEADLRFHMAIARAAGNSILQSLLGTIRGSMQTWIRKTVAARAARSIREHKRILRALRAQDPAAARAAMTAHIRLSSADLLTSTASGRTGSAAALRRS